MIILQILRQDFFLHDTHNSWYLPSPRPTSRLACQSQHRLMWGLKYLGVKVVGYLTGLGGHVGPTGHCDDLAGHPQQRVQNEAQLYGAYPLLGANKGAGLVPCTQMQA